MRRGKFDITFAALARIMRLPDNVQIAGVVCDAYDILQGRCVVYVDSEALPDVAEGADPPVVSELRMKVRADGSMLLLYDSEQFPGSP